MSEGPAEQVQERYGLSQCLPSPSPSVCQDQVVEVAMMHAILSPPLTLARPRLLKWRV